MIFKTLLILAVPCIAVVNKHHYGDPKGGCLPDERNVTIKGIQGDLCSPKCSPKSKTPCPTDLPSGVTAQPHCELTYDDGKTKGCCLTCSPSTDEASLRAGDAQCGTGSCQPVQGVGVCTYGAPPRPPPSGLPSSCTAQTDGHVFCAGNVSPEPGCERINKLCCANALPSTFAQLARYQSHHPFHSLFFKCNGNFGGGDRKWAALFASLMRNITGLHTLGLDFSFNPVASDGLVTAVEGALAANPGVSNFSIILEGSNMSDAGVSHLGRTLESRLAHTATALLVDVRYNDPGSNPTKHPVTAGGAGNLASSIGQMKALHTLTLKFGYDTAMTYKGIAKVAVGLQPLQRTLQALTLDFGYDAVTTPSGADPIPAFACLGKFLGGCTRLNALSLNLDCDVNDPQAVLSLGVHVACLPVAKMKLPGFQGYDDTTDCHCGLAVDKRKKCLIPNKNYPDLGSDCFKCMPQANATSCNMM